LDIKHVVIPTDPDSRITIGRHPTGAQPFIGEISRLEIRPITVRTEDVELDTVFSSSFESTEPVPFSGFSDGDLVFTEPGHRGEIALKHEAIGPDSHTFPYRISPPCAQTSNADDMGFQLSAWVKAPDNDAADVTLFLFCLDADYNMLWHPRAISSSRNLATPEWRRITHRHLCPNGTEYLSFRLDNDAWGEPNTPEQNTVYWDDISIGRTGRAYLNADFQLPDSRTDALLTDWEFATDSDPDLPANTIMLVPSATTSPAHLIPYGGVNNYVFSLRAKSNGVSSIHLTLDCVGDTSGSSYSSYRASTDSEWQQFSLNGSCRTGTTHAAIAVDTLGGSHEVCVDDVAVTVTSMPY
jgi:hypothetical protein